MSSSRNHIRESRLSDTTQAIWPTIDSSTHSSIRKQQSIPRKSKKVSPSDYNSVILNGITILLHPRSKNVLDRLFQEKGRIVSLPTLCQNILGGTRLTDNQVRNAISLLQETLRKYGLNQVCIERIPKEGFRLIGAESVEEEIN